MTYETYIIYTSYSIGLVIYVTYNLYFPYSIRIV